MDGDHRVLPNRIRPNWFGDRTDNMLCRDDDGGCDDLVSPRTHERRFRHVDIDWSPCLHDSNYLVCDITLRE